MQAPMQCCRRGVLRNHSSWRAIPCSGHATIEAFRQPARNARARVPDRVLPQAGKKWDDVAVDLIDNYVGGGAKPAKRATQPPPPSQRESLGNGVLILLALNFAVFALDHVLHLSIVRALPLYVAKWQWWQFLTSAFCHADFHHLASNMFMLYVFGKTVEEEEGALGVIASYLICALGGSAAFFLLNPRGVLVGASGAVFGLFAVSLLLKFRPNVRKILEFAAIAPFVYDQLTHNIAAQVTGAVGNIAYIAHLGGALAGVVLVFLLSMLPAEDS